MDDFLEDLVPAQQASEQQESGSQDNDGSLSYDAPPAEVLQRIEQTACEFIEHLAAHGKAPDVLLPQPAAAWQAGHSRERTISLFDRQGASAAAYTRIFCLLGLVQELLLSNQQASQRDVYYRLKHLTIFGTPEHVNQTIQALVAILRVPRASLGIVCSGRGVFFGRVMVCEAPGAAWTDCSDIAGGWKAIPGDCHAITKYTFSSDARYLVVVEKDAVFQRLVDDNFSELADCILVTAKGMPDMATRAFVHALLQAVPRLTAVALVDWNPSGAAILAVYKYGSQRMYEAARYALPTLGWLGARGALLHGVPNLVLQGPLSRRDHALIASLRAGALAGEPAWLEELDAMEAMDATAELEALYGHPAGFAWLLADALSAGLFA